ncbi:MAG: hypothetical protein NT070_13765 [Cyanobacteria bacterium]|nr:hypothetical protein [Cyanobacteriota bacterium]
MATQPLSREDAIYIPDSDLPIELQLVSPSIRKTSARKASTKTTASKTTASKLTTPKASTATKSKTVAKTATTRRRAVTKSVPIEDVSTSDFSASLVRLIPIQADDHPLDAPSLHAPSQAHGIVSQLQICRQSLIALQSQSQELHHRMAALTAIAQQMDELQPSRIAEFVESEIVEKIAAKKTASQTRSAAVSQDSRNYWGSESAVSAAIAVTPVSIQTRRKSELCLPNLNPSSIAETLEIPAASVGPTAAPSAVSSSAVQAPAVKHSFQSSGLNRSGISGFPTNRVSQHAEYYDGSLAFDHDPRPIAKPSQLMRSKPSQLTSQIGHKPVAQSFSNYSSQFASKSVAQPSPKSVAQPISNSVAMAITTPIVPTAGSLIQQLIPIPKGEGAIMLDALCWTLSAIGVRMSCHLLTQLVPLLTLPLTLFMLGPAIMATYLAFCVPKSSSAAVYRCLLITLGFFIGGKI